MDGEKIDFFGVKAVFFRLRTRCERRRVERTRREIRLGRPSDKRLEEKISRTIHPRA